MQSAYARTIHIKLSVTSFLLIIGCQVSHSTVSVVQRNIFIKPYRYSHNYEQIIYTNSATL